MKIVKLKGGLGNQMFQYAFAKLLQRRTGEEIRLDFSSFGGLTNDSIRVPRLTKFSLSLDAATHEEIDAICKIKFYSNSRSFAYKIGIYVEKTLNKKYFFEPNRAYINPSTIIENFYFDGYWQSYKYVDEVHNVLKNDFTPKIALSDNSLSTISLMQQQNSVLIGARKGDYTATAKARNHFGNFDSSYYRKAMQYIAEHVQNPVFYLFSNDIPWCKEYLDLNGYEVNYREPEMQTDDFEELMLMSSCKHAIIINSSYHWWGAELIENQEKIIICSQKWFIDDKPIDVIRPEWVRF